MSIIEQDGQRHEIIIVRRPRLDEEEGHHGGVWKIAFADFMTAMMCFFLVMWLINAANEETRAALASYFNPVKLIDRNASRKGLEELGGPQSIEVSPENKDDAETEDLTEPSSSGPQPDNAPPLEKSDAGSRSDEHLFSDPYAVLAEIAADTGTLQNTSSRGDGGAQNSGPASGASGGESYRDPFAPDFWSQQVDVPEAAATVERETVENAKVLEALGLAEDAEQSTDTKPATLEAQPADVTEPAKSTPSAGDSPETRTKAPETAGDPQRAAAGTEGDASAMAKMQALVEATATPAKAGEAESAAALGAAAASEAKTREAEEAAEAIRKELADSGGKLADGITVSVTEDGVMISITDELDSGMFEIGSAVPRRDLVLAMEKIGRILGERTGSVAINGHTDGRPFRSETYDNWRLSTARAHSAYFMLVRGGLGEDRIVEVAGFADRKLLIAEDPLADANRRIEILLESGG